MSYSLCWWNLHCIVIWLLSKFKTNCSNITRRGSINSRWRLKKEKNITQGTRRVSQSWFKCRLRSFQFQSHCLGWRNNIKSKPNPIPMLTQANPVDAVHRVSLSWLLNLNWVLSIYSWWFYVNIFSQRHAWASSCHSHAAFATMTLKSTPPSPLLSHPQKPPSFRYCEPTKGVNSSEQ